jgi:Nif-specific regulatory protein
MGLGEALSGEDDLRRERDLYFRLLNLGSESELEPFLEEALGLIVEITQARQGYLELTDELEEGDAPGWWMAHGCSSDDVDVIRGALSRGIIAEALATGETVMTPSALLDPRFESRASVQAGHLEAVICAPIGQDASLGVLYLQGGNEDGPFTQDDLEKAEVFAKHIGPFADRLLVKRQHLDIADPTREVRKRIRADGIVGRSPALATALREAALVAPLDVNVMITGESGTGKSQLARVLHENGTRADKPFVEVNCAALPEALIESELFGARAGAHSTAKTASEGKVAAAQGGTLFLDEIGELPMNAQAKLLQLLQSKEYYPLGASKPVHADLRLIAATNIDLEDAVRDGRFREDLYYRLHVLPIRMPTLAERKEDIPELAAALASQAAKRHGLATLGLSAGARSVIAGSVWPGNVRQLSNSIEAAVIRAAGEGSDHVEARHVFPEISRNTDDGSAGDQDVTFQEATRRFQGRLLEETLQDTNWNVSETARRLDLARSHVYNLVKSFGLERKGR